ncbi:kynurenine 3-monooxygenase [Lentithecium fluviatile CBS 122367]|uniref:Kynurenine 3-monooxygenase n=1 Tax=Lentithecium fluviatile CBS 122367 TaxID=1168545 RepID=A0A6G1IVM1_9PLEO|nr:kynurenine 3-monooxygenase [Lentithecium fluviatile CBS 122367]
MSNVPYAVAIIGAGLGGLTLALALKQQNIHVTLYELRTPVYDFGGAIMLSPNALRVLDNLGAYERIQPLGFNFDTLTFMDDADYKKTGQYYFGNEEQYGYHALRIYRNVLIRALREMVAEQHIMIQYGRKFTHVVSEDDKGVRFAFADGSEDRAEFLIGADGIHSKVRAQILPDIVPAYSGNLGVTFAFPRSKLRTPCSDFSLPASIHGPKGGFIMAPQNADGSEMFVGRQYKYPMQDRSGWDVLMKNKEELIDMHQRDMSSWSDLVQSAQEQISTSDAHSITIWPFHTVPKLSKWTSDGGRVIIIGDAAHAIPPTAGQGANQAFEDSFSLAILLGSLGPEVKLASGLRRWQAYRQERVDKVLVLSMQMLNIRLTEEEKKEVPPAQLWREDEGDQLAWLYTNSIVEDMKGVLEKKSSCPLSKIGWR